MAPMELVEYPPPTGDDTTVVTGKFVQLHLAGRELLVFAPTTLDRFHNQILARFLADREIPCHWTDPEHLVVDTPAVRVMGGGRFRVDHAQRTLTLHDNSQAYGRFQDERLVERIAAAGHPWSGYRLRIA